VTTDRRRNRVQVVALAAAWFLGGASGALAQTVPGTAADASASMSEGPSEPSVSPDSPRAAIEELRALSLERNWTEAARFLDLSGRRSTEGELLARRLALVLDHHGWPDPGRLSPSSEGMADDGLPAGVDEVVRLPVSNGQREALRLVRNPSQDGPSWRVSRLSVGRIDDWFEALPGQWMYEALPNWLLLPAYWGLLRWQLLALLPLVVLALLLAIPLASLTRKALLLAARRTRSSWDDALAVSMRGPLRVAWLLILLRVALPWLIFAPEALGHLYRVLIALAWVDFFWVLFRAMDVLHRGLEQSPWAKDSASGRFLLSFGTRLGKLLVAGLGLVAALAALGYPVASLMAGLGIGGLALALAAQKTVENLFGAFAIGVDRPIQVGDFIQVEGVSGTVESIGLRSTRIRTMDRVLVSIPNGKLADMRLENLTARDRFRLYTVIGLEYGTSAARIRQVTGEIEARLRGHPKVWPDRVVVRFMQFGASSLDIEIMAWFLAQDAYEFWEIRHQVLLDIMEMVQGAGCAFAFPTRTVHIASQPSRDRPEA